MSARRSPNVGSLVWVCLTALVVGCGGASGDAAETGDDQEVRATPKLEACEILDKQVDSCLEELGSIGGSLEDCIDVKAKEPTSCCKRYGTRFNYCR